MRNPYEVLGVSKTASEAEIKKAFRSLAKKHHPDSHGGDKSGQKRFQEISAAYEIVGDKDKRAKFDRGEIDASGNPRGFDPRAHGFDGTSAGGRDFHFTWSPQEGDTAQGFQAEDIFSDLFGGGSRRRNQPRKGQDIEYALTVGFEEAAAGATKRITLPDGRELDVRIPVGLKDGQHIRLKGQGAPGRGNGPAGDIVLTVSVAAHPYLTRDGNDLKMDLPVTLKEAVLGGKVTAPTLTGPVTLTVPPNSNTGTTLRLKGKGIPARGGETAGNLYVRLAVSLPEKADPALKQFLEHWATDYDPRAKLR